MADGNVTKSASELLEESANPFDEACMIVRVMEKELAALNEMKAASKSSYKWKQFRQKLVREQSSRMGRKLSFSDAIRYMYG